MLTNEQRAHDLALIVVRFKLSPEALKGEGVRGGGDTLRINIDEIYFEAYESALRAINRRYPPKD